MKKKLRRTTSESNIVIIGYGDILQIEETAFDTILKRKNQ